MSPLRAVILARPFCKGFAANMKHYLLSVYFNTQQKTLHLIMLPHMSWAKIPRKTSVETPFPQTRIKRESVKKNQAAHVSAPSGVCSEVRCIFISAAKLVMWDNELSHARDNGCPLLNCALTYQSLVNTSVKDLRDKKLLKLQMNCS